MDTPLASELSPLPELQFDLTAPGARILHPVDPGFAAVAKELADTLGPLIGASLAVVPEDESSALAGSGPLLVMGNLMESTLVQRLYYESYDFTDLAFPGPGGFSLRTIRDPFGGGAHVIMIGGSDVGGVKAAAAQFVTLVKKQGSTLGYFNEVRLGQWTTAAELDPARYLEDRDEDWGRVGESGSWEFMEHIAACGVGYLRTANERYLELLQRELHYFKSHDVYAPNPEAPSQIHGRIYVLLIIWDLLQDHPFFTPEDRREFDTMFLYLERSGEGVVQFKERSLTTAVRFNHDTRAALDAFYVGRYFDRRHHLPEAREWLQAAADLFAPQLTSAKPCEDSWGHQWAASMHNTLCYAMATGESDYFKSAACREAADRALMAHGADGPRVYLASCAMVTGDSSYLSLERNGESLVHSAARMRLSRPPDTSDAASYEEVLRSFVTTTGINRRDHMLGHALAPIDHLWYHTIESPAYNPDGIFKITLKEDEGFDKLALREGWRAEDYYLLIDGISGGLHSFQDANCIVWYREDGMDWFRTARNRQRAQGVRAQNGVNVVLNGRGFDHVHRYTRLLYRDTQGEYLATGTSLDGVGDATWERHILRKRGAWTLVLDRVIAHTNGELLAERFWYPQGEHEIEASGFGSRQTADEAGVMLHIASTVDANGRGVAYDGFIERVRTEVEVGGDLVLGGLLWTNAGGAESVKLGKTPEGFKVEEASGATTEIQLQHREGTGCGLVVRCADMNLTLGRAGKSVAMSEASELPMAPLLEELDPGFREINLPEKTITAVANGPLGNVLGTSDGVVVLHDPAQGEMWRAQVSGQILSMEFSSEGIVVGEESGALSLLDHHGRILWTVDIPWVSLPWASWSEYRSRIREIACADIDGDGRDEILISNADRRVYAFDCTGRELWKRPIQWGVFTAMWLGVHEGNKVLLGGTSRPSIHGYVVLLNLDGTVRGHTKRADLVCWGLPANLRDLQQADIDGDGCIETITAVDTNCRQLIAYGDDGKVKWDCDVGGCATALVFDPVTQRVLVTSEAGYVVAVDGSSGQRAWVAWVGETTELIWVLPGGRIVAVAQRGVIWMILPTGEIQGQIDLGEPITAIPRPGNHRGPGRNFIIGTQSGRVLTLP